MRMRRMTAMIAKYVSDVGVFRALVCGRWSVNHKLDAVVCYDKTARYRCIVVASALEEISGINYS